MSSYFSRLASRTGLMKKSQHSGFGIVSDVNSSKPVSRVHQPDLEVHTEHSIAGNPVTTLSDIESSPESFFQKNIATVSESGQSDSSRQVEKNISFPLAQRTAEMTNVLETHHTTGLGQNYAMERNESGERARVSDVVEPTTHIFQSVSDLHVKSEKAVEKPAASSNEAGFQRGTVESKTDSFSVKPELKVQPEQVKRGIHLSDIPEKIPPQNPQEANRPRVSLLKDNKRELQVSDQVVHVVDAERAPKTSWNDSHGAVQHFNAPAGKKQGEEPQQQHPQINIQSITLEIHQHEPVQKAAPIPVPRKSTSTPAQNHPSQTRLSRYYLKGW